MSKKVASNVYIKKNINWVNLGGGGKLYSIIALHEMCRIPKCASTEKPSCIEVFQEVQRACQKSIWSVLTACCLQYRPS